MNNWGVRIALIYSTFVIGILCMVFLAINQKIDLVSPDYYAKELKFQDQIDQTKNARNVEIKTIVSRQTITLHLPFEFKNLLISGTILFFKPSDSKKDRQFPLKCDASCTQTIPTRTLANGMYKLKINWEVNHQKYYQEKEIVINNY
jgi:hypothetical protein